MSDRDPNGRNPTGAGSPTGDDDRVGANATPVEITGGDVRTEAIAPEATARGAEVGEARLAGVLGVGTLQVVRDPDGHVLHREGTWRPRDEGADVSAIDAGVDAGRPMRYEGKLHDPAEPGRDRWEGDVTVTSRSEYTYDAREEDTGARFPLFNFRPAEDARPSGR